MQRDDDQRPWGLRCAALTGVMIASALLSARAAAEDIRIEHVTVVSPESSRALPDTNVTVHEGRVAAIVPAAILATTPAFAAAGAAPDASVGRAAVSVTGADSVAAVARVPTRAAEVNANPEVASASRSSSTPRVSWLRTVFSERFKASATSGEERPSQ